VDLTKKARKGICCYFMSPKEPFATEMHLTVMHRRLPGGKDVFFEEALADKFF